MHELVSYKKNYNHHHDGYETTVCLTLSFTVMKLFICSNKWEKDKEEERRERENEATSIINFSSSINYIFSNLLYAFCENLLILIA